MMSTYIDRDHWDSCGLIHLVDYANDESGWAVIRVKLKDRTNL